MFYCIFKKKKKDTLNKRFDHKYAKKNNMEKIYLNATNIFTIIFEI